MAYQETASFSRPKKQKQTRKNHISSNTEFSIWKKKWLRMQLNRNEKKFWNVYQSHSDFSS